ncbi:MAG: hypothetical protein ACYDAO_02440 [Thermoplasmataceae archaeon]
MITYNTLEEALRDGVKFMDCGNGDYAEYLTFSDGYFVVEHWVYGHGGVIKKSKTLSDLLKLKKYSFWNNITRGKKTMFYDEKSLPEYFKMFLDLEYDKGLFSGIQHMTLLKVIDRSYFYSLSFYKDNFKYVWKDGEKVEVPEDRYDLELKKEMIYGMMPPILFHTISHNKDGVAVDFQNLMTFLKEHDITDGWYEEVEVEVKS